MLQEYSIEYITISLYHCIQRRGMLCNLNISKTNIYTIIVVNTKLFDMFMENKNPVSHICNLKF